ncbi:MAG: hypothetical protein FWG63_10765 [Defluviitaleaceae bacterium]|nr:hypothetical protein [Defluviitaleaceae bacterium]
MLKKIIGRKDEKANFTKVTMAKTELGQNQAEFIKEMKKKYDTANKEMKRKYDATNSYLFLRVRFF